MKTEQKVHPSIFVIHSPDGAAIADSDDSLEKLGKIVPLEEFADFCLLYLENESEDEKESEDAKETWQRLRDELAPEFALEPVFIDYGGRLSYATGLVTVRFTKTPTDDELKQFARQWGLRFKARNPYVPSQATFDKTAGTLNHYLPDIIDSIKRSAKQVRAVWPDTISRYLKI